ncbi:hypothetical protein [Mycobacterium sp.]|uniref:hypothetical protein n=1 Tax=Mycobacterium sp. TaxID=1785 RepID=UPI0031D274CC
MNQTQDHDGQQSAAHRWLASESPIEQVSIASLQQGDSPRLESDSKPQDARLRGDAKVVANNTAHGQPLTPTDRNAAAARILAMHPGWSDRMIASIAGLSHPTVAAIRRRSLSTGKTFQSNRRLGQDGKTRPAALRDSHKVTAAAAVHADQNESLHGVGGQANGPVGAVHDLRARRKQDEQPSGAKTHAAGVDVFLARGQAVVQKLRNNPSVWRTDNGKALTRMLLHSVQLVGLVQAASSAVPEHCRGVIAEAASALSDAWRRLAQELRALNRIG